MRFPWPFGPMLVAFLALSAVPAPAFNPANPFVPERRSETPISRTVFWHDDLEDGALGWTHGDETAQIPQFHIDAYMAYGDTCEQTPYSWWCGELNPEFSGGDGYGNQWDQRLNLPPIGLGWVATKQTSWGSIKALYRESAQRPNSESKPRSVVPVLTFHYRHDCERGYDFVWVEAESLGEWVALNPGGWDGSSGGWRDPPDGGFDLSGFGDPLHVRFRFVSDYTYSDADGLYQSDGGAFHVDDITVYDAVTGEVLFVENCDGGSGRCVPTIPEASGDCWHIVDSACSAYDGTHAWSVSWPDSTRVPPNLRNWLMTPVVDVGQAYACTLYYRFQPFIPSDYGASWQECSSTDGGATWSVTGWWYMHQCQIGHGLYGACDHLAFQIPIVGPGMPAGNQARVKWVIYTGSEEIDCHDVECEQGYCRAGFTIDDVWIIGYGPGRGGESRWERIRSLCE